MSFDTWLTVDGYKAWARITDTQDDAAIASAVAAVDSAVKLRCSLAFAWDEADPPVELPVPGDVVYAGFLWVNRLVARRNSPDGMIGVPELGAAQLRTVDPDVSRLLSPWTEPVVA